ncbi:hypothetical protein N7447_006998 [Penicillium robsamsonii]|uniref:uncharacterized protein n=1 Tax=Penicillium robsamsonii TaxID=1792511 RepID=UPI0025477B87|nr:uncharacterized protein N7447_006998 [Penicillium robsamsonii]KAJ5824658.1 hypothetical protein N7447_006998 [Penicillium robsamsonii]
MRFSIFALATFIGLAFAAPIEAEKDSATSAQVNNCYTLCKIDGGFISASIALVLSLAMLVAALPAELDKSACPVKKCAAADPAKCCPDKYGFCNTDTKECKCGIDCL